MNCFFGELGVVGDSPGENTAFPCTSAAVLPKTDAFACAAAGNRIRRRSAQARLQCTLSVLNKVTLDELRQVRSSPDRRCQSPAAVAVSTAAR